MTSYYTDYRAKSTAFTSSYTSGTTTRNTTYRINATQTDIRCYQGMNKGSSLTNNATNMNNQLTRFNNNAVGNYVRWKYENGTFSFVHRHHTTPEREVTVITANIEDPYNTQNYSYHWYLNNVLQGSTTRTLTVPLMRYTEDTYTVVTYDGSYYGVSEIITERTTIGVKFTRQWNTLTATLGGEQQVLRTKWLCVCLV